jgi:acetyltransferase-like isoleucine patch superfamily enzyme
MITMSRRLLRGLIARLPPRAQAAYIAVRSRGKPLLGRGAYVHRSVQMLGKAHVRLGKNSVLSQDCWLNVNHRSAGDIAIDIGDHCFIGRRNFFSSGQRIVIGHYVLTANDCHFLGSSHIVSDPLKPYISTGTTDTDTIVVGHNTFLGAGARVLGHVQIGHGCIIGASALVTRDVPPFSQVAGFPATVRRRFSFLRQEWVEIGSFTLEDEATLPDAENYLSHLRQNPAPQMPYIAAGSDMGQC